MKTKLNPGDKLTIIVYGRQIKVKVIEVTLWRADNTVAYLVRECGGHKTHWLQYDATGLLRKV